MGDVIRFPIDLNTDLGHELVVDMARFSEGIVTEEQIRKRYHFFDNAVWERLGADEALIEKIDAEKVRRIRNGATARERAQVLFAKDVPTVLETILNDSTASPRHRLESAKEIRTVAGAGGPEAVPASDRFQITIILNADGTGDAHDNTLRFDKSIAVDANDIDPNDVNTTPALAAIAAKKGEDDGNGEPL